MGKWACLAIAVIWISVAVSSFFGPVDADARDGEIFMAIFATLFVIIGEKAA